MKIAVPALSFFFAAGLCVSPCALGQVRSEVIGLFGGEKVGGAEVCYQKLGEKPGFLMHFEHPEIRCYPADRLISVPSGRWSYFLEHRNRMLVSTHASIKTIDPATTGREYAKTTSTMFTAGILELSSALANLESGSHLFIYLANWHHVESPPTVQAVRSDVPSRLVPANSPVVVIKTRDGAILDVSDPITVQAGKLKSFPGFPRPPSRERSTVVTWSEVPKEERIPGDHWDRIAPPRVVLEAGGAVHKPSLDPKTGAMHHGLLIFRNVDMRQGGNLRLEGPFWVPALVSLGPGEGELLLEARPIPAVPAATVTTRLSGVDPPLDFAGIAKCATAASKEKGLSNISVVIYRCKDAKPGEMIRETTPLKCVAFENRNLAIDSSEIEFPSVPRGSYMVEVTRSGRPERSPVFSLWPGDVPVIELSVSDFVVFGRLTKNRENFQGLLRFRNNGLALSDSGTGQYRASMPSPPGVLPVEITDCRDGTTYTHIPSAPVPNNLPYDIDIKAREQTVRVLEKETGKPVPKATIRAAVFLNQENEEGEFLSLTDPMTDETGVKKIVNLPVSSDFALCAEAKGFQRHCTERIKAGNQADVTINLTRVMRRGRIIAPGAIRFGRLFLVAENGVLLERLDVSTEGEFEYSAAGESARYAVVVSQFPLFVTARAANSLADYVIQIPTLPSRNITIVTSDANPSAESLRIRLTVGSFYVPFAALAHHQSIRGQTCCSTRRGATLAVREVIESGAISIIVGPDLGHPSLSALPDGVDDFTIPALRATYRRIPVSASGIVLIEP